MDLNSATVNRFELEETEAFSSDFSDLNVFPNGKPISLSSMDAVF